MPDGKTMTSKHMHVMYTPSSEVGGAGRSSEVERSLMVRWIIHIREKEGRKCFI